MTNEQLEQANKLASEIKDFKSALRCFEWSWDGPDDEKPTYYQPTSTNPSIIIAFDGCDGREQIKLPNSLSDAFVDFMKEHIKGLLKEAEDEFSKL